MVFYESAEMVEAAENVSFQECITGIFCNRA